MGLMAQRPHPSLPCCQSRAAMAARTSGATADGPRGLGGRWWRPRTGTTPTTTASMLLMWCSPWRGCLRRTPSRGSSPTWSCCAPSSLPPCTTSATRVRPRLPALPPALPRAVLAPRGRGVWGRCTAAACSQACEGQAQAPSIDVWHALAPGVRNDFLVNLGTEAAVRYNDNSVNENGHAALTFEVLYQHAHNFIAHMSNDERRFFRRMIVNIVLSTDMSVHDEQIKVITCCLHRA